MGRPLSRGFSLVELILAVFLVAMIMAGLSSFQGGIGRDKGRIVQDNAVQTQADYARKIITRALAEATLLQSPGPFGCTSNELVGWTNLRKSFIDVDKYVPIMIDCGGACDVPCSPNTPLNKSQSWYSLVDLDGDGRYHTGDDVSYFRICLSNEKQLHYYWGPGAAVPSGGCGSAGFSGTGHGKALIAGEPKGTVTVSPLSTRVFSRRAGQANYLQLGYRVEHGGGTTLEKVSVDVNTGVELLEASQ
jgi:prepilin-type N-terminal cleavage/methylation domain-containing protein